MKAIYELVDAVESRGDGIIEALKDLSYEVSDLSFTIRESAYYRKSGSVRREPLTSEECPDHARAELARRLTIVVDEVGGIKPAARSLGVDVTTMRLALKGKRITNVSRRVLVAACDLRLP